jgi:hypothetical protein
MRFRLRTLLILAALGPPVLAGMWLARTWLPADLELATPFLLGFGIYLSIVALAVALHLYSTRKEG